MSYLKSLFCPTVDSVLAGINNLVKRLERVAKRSAEAAVAERRAIVSAQKRVEALDNETCRALETAQRIRETFRL
ncbi:hypothetical protein IS481_11980 [Caldimonas thermodepolymerans]|uniref:Uncharacterized protein n=1 Tax=Caldimonas thermodepolymerans TaxID=215580 RepID=A0A2S5T925_9BURK|nr:hypothetical protein [Caldimonas thermodepolymerans]PPE71459.1 hypothetical protein C1702_00195 [Caldimonas thermodepolymerans]QPC30488.1 hypothetical protein IS481_11980 [Caldimonas thermodepolymerans]RDI02929.1 hypothetical protein DES46_102357 [Caldimonas thermodepolymerans]